MSKRYFILGAVLIIAAFGLMFLPDSINRDKVPPEKLLKEMMSQSRYLSPDLVAARLIDEDPSIFLVDVRTAKQYNSYSMPGAINIPLENILDKEFQVYFEQDGMDVVLISNDDLYADQAWMLCARLGYENIYIMAGGLNRWFDEIMQPEIPPATAPNEAFDLYTFRKGASLYFGGSNMELNAPNSSGQNVQIIKREKKAATTGGC